jgi:hypothetical protein
LGFVEIRKAHITSKKVFKLTPPKKHLALRIES